MSDVSNVSSGNSSTGAAIITSLGIGSGLNSSSIISQLMAVQDQPVTLLQNQMASAQSTVSVFGQLKSALSSFQSSLQGLSLVGQYQSISATVANSSVATAATTTGAASGTYSLQVGQLAQAETLVTAGQPSSTSAIGTGTISFNFGTINGTAKNGQYGSGTTFTNSGAAAKTVTIDSSNNSLTGIAAAINAANIGVTASIMNDGTSNPARLTLTSNNTGAANSMQISVSGDTALTNLLNQDPAATQNLTETSAAQSAQFTLNGVAISSNTNTDSNAINGVTLNLLATTTTPTTLTVSTNTNGAVSAINSFVSAYNTIATTMQQATAYNSSTKQAGPLQGQNSVLSIMSQMQSILDNPVPGAPSAISMLGQIGVGFTSGGTLQVDSAKLQTALTNNPTAVSGLFASIGSSTDTLTNYTGSTSSTQPGAYGVNITQMATQGSTVGNGAASTTITKGQNDTLTLNLDGVSSNVTLAAGTYTGASLATALQSAINSNNTFSTAGKTATVTQNNGVLSIFSNSYGSTSIANISGGNGLDSLLGVSGSPTVTTGLDVAGTINGQAATGSGQTLTSSNGASAGLAIQILGGDIGSRGIINYTQGYANALNDYLTTALGTTGSIAAATAGLNSTVTAYQNTINTDNSINAQILQNYQAEFSALDVTMSTLQSTSTFLTQQLAALAK